MEYQKPSPASAESDPAINPDITVSLVSEGDEDIYVLLQGPAHIIPGADGKIEVAFLNEALERKTPIVFTLEPDPARLTGLKIRNLQLIIECNEEKFNALKGQGQLSQYFPETFDVITKSPENIRHMNPPPPPPFNKG